MNPVSQDYSMLRRFPRVPVYCPVTVQEASGTEEVAATSLNEGGLLLLKQPPPLTDDKLQLKLRLPEGQIISVTAAPRSVVPGIGFGVEFLGLASEQLVQIRQSVDKAYYDPSLRLENPPSVDRVQLQNEMRAEPRVTIFFDCQMESAHLFGRCKVCNVSRSGLAVQTAMPFQVHEEITIVGPLAKFVAKAEVRNVVPWGKRYRVGLKLLHVSGNWILS